MKLGVCCVLKQDGCKGCCSSVLCSCTVCCSFILGARLCMLLYGAVLQAVSRRSMQH
jgi:hypothetical protein